MHIQGATLVGIIIILLSGAALADSVAGTRSRELQEQKHEIDMNHEVENVWAVGKCLHRDDSPELEAWVTEQKLRLRRGSFDAYHRLRHLDLDIATGVVEGACATSSGSASTDQVCAGGSIASSASFTCAAFSSLACGATFVDHLADRQLCLAVQPMPVRTHDAKPVKQAA